MERKRRRPGSAEFEHGPPAENSRPLSPAQVHYGNDGPRWSIAAPPMSLPHEMTTTTTTTAAAIGGAPAPAPDDFRRCLWEQAQEGRFCDIAFAFADGGVDIRAHRNVLCSRSEVFRKMLYSGLLEAKTGVVHIRDFSRASFLCFIECVYLGSPGEHWREGIDGRELWGLADKYDVPDVHTCLLSRLNGHNVAAAAHYAIAHGYGDMPLGNACLQTSSKVLKRIEPHSLNGVCSGVVRLLLSGGGGRALDRCKVIEDWAEVNECEGEEAHSLICDLVDLVKLPSEHLSSLVGRGLLTEEVIRARTMRVEHGVDSAWRSLGCISSRGSQPGHLLEPRGIAITPSGLEIIVCDSGNRRVQVLSLVEGGREVMTLGAPAVGIAEEGGGGLQNPCGVAVHPVSGDYYVTDFGSNLVNSYCSISGALLGSIRGGGAGFSGCWGVSVSPVSGNVFVTDLSMHNVQVFSPDGAFLTSFGEHGGLQGQLRMPCGICVTWQGQVIVCDGGNDRLQVFSEDGQFLRTIRPRSPGRLDGPDSVSVGFDGEIAVSCWKQDRIVVLDQNGCYLRSHNGKDEIGPGCNTGNSTGGIGRLMVPSGVAWGEPGQLYVAELGGSRVRSFGGGGITRGPSLHPSRADVCL